MKEETRFSSYSVKSLIECLQRIQRIDEVTKEDAYNLLVGAFALNYQFIMLSGVAEDHEETVRLIWGRFCQIVDWRDEA